MAKILVVDDDVKITEMLQDILGAEEHTVTAVQTGQDGVQTFAREPFDLVMQDVNLPGGVSGYGACQTYKSLRDTVAVIMMTGDFKSDQDEALARRLGADGFLRKPFAARQLLEEVAHGLEARAEVLGEMPVYTCRACEAQFPTQGALPRKEGSLRVACPNCGHMASVTQKDVMWENPEDRTAPRGPDARRILVVEDNANYRHFLAFLLKRAGHVVLEAKSGLEGLAFAKRWEPHLVITDVMLPDLDGLTMVEKIKEQPQTARIPTVLLTSFQAEAHKQQAQKMGVTYLSKPIKPGILLEAVNQLMTG